MVLNNITKKYGDKVIFNQFSYSFQPNKITVILGDSGVGKTTLINIMLGVTEYDGEVKKDGSIACVFQNDRLLPNLSVRNNLLLVNDRLNVEEALTKVDMLNAIDYMPNMLSAGMSRRVSILRAMNYDAKYLIMDEPLRNLDYYNKYKMLDEIKSYHKKNNNTIIIVTHDIKEAVYIADKIIVLQDGQIALEIDDINDSTENKLLETLLQSKNV